MSPFPVKGTDFSGLLCRLKNKMKLLPGTSIHVNVDYCRLVKAFFEGLDGILDFKDPIVSVIAT